MEIIKVSENSKLIRVKLGEIKPNRFRDLERWPVEREVIDGLKAAFEKEGFWSKSVQSILNDKNEVELRFGHHRVIAATEYFGADHEVEIDLVEYRGDNSMFQAMKLENSVNRNKVKVANELIDQSMHWFDDVVFEQYPTWEDVIKADIFSRLELDEYFGGTPTDDIGGRNYAQCVEYGVGKRTIAKHTSRDTNEIEEYLKSNFTVRRKRGMEIRTQREFAKAEEKRIEEARLKAEQDEANRIAKAKKDADDAEAKRLKDLEKAAELALKKAKDEDEKELKRLAREEAKRQREEAEEQRKIDEEEQLAEQRKRDAEQEKVRREREQAEKNAKAVLIGEWYDSKASEVFDVPAHGKAFRESVSRDDVRPYLQTEMLVPFAKAIKERLENDSKSLSRQMLTDSNIRSSVHEFFMTFKNTMKIEERKVIESSEKDNQNLKLIRLLEKAVTDGNRFSGTLADIESCMKANGFTAVDGPSAGEFMDVLSKVIARSAFFNPRVYK